MNAALHSEQCVGRACIVCGRCVTQAESKFCTFCGVAVPQMHDHMRRELEAMFGRSMPDWDHKWANTGKGKTV